MNFFLHFCLGRLRIGGLFWSRQMSVYGIGKNDAKLAAQFLKEGKIIALPTDTIYGLAAVAQDTAAILKLYQTKGRDNEKPLAICVSSIEEVCLWGQIGSLPYDLLHSLLPGPVTVVLNRTPLLNPHLNPNTPKVGIRIPDHQFVQEVSKLVGSPLALTSANRSNEPSCVLPIEFEALWAQMGGVFDGGLVGHLRSGSTVVDLSIPGKYHILRSGSALQNTKMLLERFNLTQIEKL